MPWLSRNTFQPSDKLHSDDLNNLANDDRTWGGNVNGGGYTLSNVNIVAVNPTAGGGGVTSFNTRNGDVMPQGNGQDYTAAMVNAVPLTRQVITGNVAVTGLTGGGPLGTDLTLSAAVVSVFGRSGNVALNATDITNAGGVPSTRQIKTLAGSGLQNGGALSTDLSLSVVPDSIQQPIQVMSGGNPIGSPRSRLNFISGSGALVTVSEISVQNRIDVTVASTGTGGFVDPTQLQGDLIVRGLTAPATRLAVGTVDGQVLTVDHLQPQGVKWAAPAATNAVTSVFGKTGAILASAADGYTAAMVANAVDQQGAYNLPQWIKSLSWNVITNVPAFMLDPTGAKGDLIVHGATTTKLPLGGDGTVLTADSSLALGVKWFPLPITSFNTRGGAVVPGGQDYTVDMIAGAVPTSRAINTVQAPPSGLTGGGPLSGNLSLSVVPDTTNQQVQIWQEGITLIGTRKALNFKSGAGVALTIVDSPPGTGNNRVDITIASSGTGTGGGLVDPTTQKGDLIVRPSTVAPPGAFAVGANGKVLTADDTQQFGMRWATPSAGGAGSQTPWLGPIDAGGNNLNNAGGIGVNIASDITKARVYAFVNALEDGLRVKTGNGAALAAASFVNDAGDTLTLRSYGTTFVGGLPGLASIEASNILAIFANSAEVMRLKAGRVLIGTTTDDNVNKLQVNGTVKSKTGGFVFPDNTTQVTAFTAAASAVTSVFTRTGAVVAATTAPFDYSASNVTNAVDSSVTYNNPAWINTLAWSKITGLPTPALLQDPTTTKGDLIARGNAGPATRLAVSATNGWVLTADSAQPLGVKWASTPAQTPWTSNIDGGGFTLFSVGKLGVGVAVPYSTLHVKAGASGASSAVNTDTVAFFDHSSNAYLEVVAGAGKQAGVILGANAQTNATQLMDVWDGTNHNLSLNAGVAGSYITFSTVASEKMRITTIGSVGIGNNGTPPYSSPTFTALMVGPQTGTSCGYFVTCGNASTGGGQVGGFSFANYGITGPDKRIAMIQGVTDGTLDKGTMTFSTFIAGAPTERMRIVSSGQVGIGLNNPACALHVKDPAGGDTYICLGDNVSSQRRWFLDSSNGTWLPTGGFGIIDGSANVLRFAIDVNGNCGIGTAAPLYKLHVSSNANNLLLEGATAAGGNTPGVFFRTNPATPTTWAAARIAVVDSGTAYGGNLLFYTNSGNDSGTTTGTEKMRITDAGNCGIGTTGPTYKLDVNGSFAANTADIRSSAPTLRIWETTGNNTITQSIDSGGMVYWKKWDGSIQMMLNTSNGNVAIGPSSPLNLFTVTPAGANPTTLATCNQIAIGEYTNNPDYRLVFGFGTVPGWSGVIQAMAGGPGGGILLINPAGGTCGIRKQSPGYPLDVAGDINASLYRLNGVPTVSITGRYDQTGARAMNGVYQNGNSRPIWVCIYAIINVASYMKLLTDAGNPPTNAVCASTNVATGGGITMGGSVVGFVMPGHFYKVETPGATLTTWYEYL